MTFKRLFTTSEVKGKENYIRTQKKYEIIRTISYYCISIALFLCGWLQTGQRTNLLTIVAILGCLPASKSAVNAIMFLRFKGCSESALNRIKQHIDGPQELYDCVFTSYQINYCISHIAVCGNTVCGFSEDPKFEENKFYQHIMDILKLDGHKDVTIKIFTDLDRYLERIEQMNDLPKETAKTEAVIETLKSVML